MRDRCPLPFGELSQRVEQAGGFGRDVGALGHRREPATLPETCSSLAERDLPDQRGRLLDRVLRGQRPRERFGDGIGRDLKIAGVGEKRVAQARSVVT